MSRRDARRKPLLIALGHTLRSDDAAGPKVLEAVRGRMPEGFDFVHHSGDPSDLIDVWTDRDVLLVDASYGDDDAPPMTVFDPLVDRNTADAGSSPGLQDGQGRVTSSHALSLAEALELGRTLDKLPDSMSIVAVAGRDFGFGDRLTPMAERGVAAASEWIIGSLRGVGKGDANCTKAP